MPPKKADKEQKISTEIIHARQQATHQQTHPGDNFLEHAVNASLVNMLDKFIMVILGDGTKLIGVLRTFDQFSNIVLEDTFERKSCGTLYCDVRLGLYLVRGENIVLMGDVDKSRQNHLRKVTLQELIAADDKNHSGIVGGTDLKLYGGLCFP